MTFGLARRGPLVAAVFVWMIASLGGTAMPGPDQTLHYPTPQVKAFGPTRLIGEPDSDVPVSGVAVFVAAGLDRETPKQSGAAALVARCIIDTAVGSMPLRDAIAARGGSIDYTIDGRSTRFYLEGRAADLPTLVGLLAKAMAAPDFSGPAVTAARANVSRQIGETQANALAVGIDMFRQAYYASGAGLPALGTVAGLAQLGPADLRTFYAGTYVRAAVSASAVGSVSPELAAAVAAVANGLPNGTVSNVAEKANPLAAPATRIVAQRDIPAPWIVLGFAAPSPDSSDFGPMLVLEALLSRIFESSTALDVADKPIGALYLYDATPAGMVVYVDGSLTDPSVALREILFAVQSLVTKPVSAPSLAKFKTAAQGRFLVDSVSLSDRAYLLGTLSSQGLGDDPINAALAALNRTTAADVQRVAKRYLGRYIVALVLPRRRAAGG